MPSEYAISAAISAREERVEQETDATGNHHSNRVHLIEGKTGIRRGLTDNRINLLCGRIEARIPFRLDFSTPTRRPQVSPLVSTTDSFLLDR